MSRVVLAVDIGTTATKVVALTPDGKRPAEASRSYKLSVPERGAAELDPEEVRRAALEAIGTCVTECEVEIAALCLVSAMHSVIAIDEKGDPLTACITFADERASEQARVLREGKDGRELHRRTGTPIYAMAPLTKLAWLRETRGKVFESASKFVSIKEFVLAGLSGDAPTDLSSASSTGLFSLEDRDWDDFALDAIGLERKKLCDIVPVTEGVALRSDVAGALGLHTSIPVIVGGADGPFANLGTGVLGPGMLSITVGTSGAVRSTVPDITIDPNGALFCYVMEGSRYVVGGPINNGGVVVDWLGHLLFDDDEMTHAGDLDELAAGAPPGSNGLVVLPFLTGERAPLWSSDARAVMFGLSLQHHRSHVTRAWMEGVAYALRTVSDLLEPLTGKAESIRAGGGFVNSHLWVQILADIMGLPVSVCDSVDSSTIGAALIGLSAIGELELSDIDEMVDTVKTCEPHRENQDVYADTLNLYRSLSEELGDAFRVSASLSYEQPERRAATSAADEDV